MQNAPVVTERPPRLGIVEGIVRTDLCRRGKPADETGFLAVGSGYALRSASSASCPEFFGTAARAMRQWRTSYDMLEPPPPDDLTIIDAADGIVGHQTGPVGPVGPRLLVVHDIRDLIVVRLGAVLFDVVAPRRQGLHFVVRKDGRVGVDDGMIVEFGPAPRTGGSRTGPGVGQVPTRPRAPICLRR